MLYRDLSDSNKTKLTNDGVDVINISGTDGLTAVDIQQQNPIMRIQSLNTGVTAHSTISLGITGGDSWNLSAGVSGLSNPDTDFGFHISKNDNELMTIRNNGNIGFGTTDPEYDLDIFGNSRTQGDFIVSGNIFINGVSGTADVDNIWYTDNSNNVISDAFSGNYGIGTPTPSNKLEVVGSIGVSGNIVPLIDSEFDLGTTGSRFRDLYLSGETIYIGDVAMGSNSTQLNITGSMNIENDVTIGGNLNATGNIDISGDTQLNSLGITTTLDVTGDAAFDSNTLYIDASANSVGIGTTTPDNDLHVVGDGKFTNSIIIGTTSTANSGILIDTGIVEEGQTRNFLKIATPGGNTHMRFARLGTATDEVLDITKNYYRTTNDGFTVEDASTGSHVLGFNTDGSFTFSNAAAGAGMPIERMKIENDGKVCIGTTIPLRLFNVQEDDAVSLSQLRIGNSNTTGRAGIELDNGGTNVFKIQQNTNDTVLENFAGNINYLASGAGDHTFFTTNSNEIRMRIKNDGNVGIGTTNPTQKLHLHADGGTGVGSLFTNGNNTTGGLVGLNTGGDLIVSQGSASHDIIFNIGGSGIVQIDNSGLVSMGSLDISQNNKITYRNDSDKFFPKTHRIEDITGGTTTTMTFSDLGLGQAFTMNTAGVYTVQTSRNDGDYANATNPFWIGKIAISNFAGGKSVVMSTDGSNQFTSISINDSTKVITWEWSVTAPSMLASYNLFS